VQDDNAKIFHVSFFKLAFLMLEVQLVFAQTFHNNAGDGVMFFQCRHEDEDVVKIDGDDALGDEVLKDLVHHR
jgi:hypothetical protein